MRTIQDKQNIQILNKERICISRISFCFRLQCGSAQYRPREAVDTKYALVLCNHRTLTLGYTISQIKKIIITFQLYFSGDLKKEIIYH